MKTRKLLAMLLMLAMIVGLLGISAYATTSSIASFTFSNDNNITEANVAGVGSGTLKILDTRGPETEDNVKTCQVELSPNSTASSATVTLKNGSSTVDTLTVSLPTTTPTETYITSTSTTITDTSVTPHVTTTYVFYFVMETSYTTGTNNGGVYISLPDDGVALGTGSSSGSTYTYANATTTTSGFPQNVSLRLVPGGSSYDTVSDVVVTKNSSSSANVTIEHYAGTYYLINFPLNATTANFTVSYKLGGTAQTPVTFSITMRYNASTDPGSGIWSYLPAPGQFTNEGVGTGGWGDIHKSGSAELKDMVGAVTTTGVSLGAFGGSIVFDFDEDGISDSNKNPFGVDFIIYGNAFSTNAEPGCVQVAPDDDNDGIPDKWYDIAGSLYYSGETVTMYYSDPTPADNTSAGTSTPTSTRANVPYSTNVTISGTTQTWANIGSLTTNTFHNHSWFPLARNYFDGIERNAKTYNGSDASGPMANVSSLTPETGSNPISVMEEQTIVGGLSSTTVISYSGRKIPWKGAGAGNYTFGYADVHANGSSYGTAANPYAATQTTTGGDGIDIAWAVNSDGTPANLTKIRFVRVYTGVQQVTGFGEVSTEVCGVYIAEPATGDVGTTTAPSIYVNNSGYTLADYAAAGYASVSTVGNVTIYYAPSLVSVGTTVSATGASYIYVNNETNSHVVASGENMIRVIAQTGDAAPSITLITY